MANMATAIHPAAVQGIEIREARDAHGAPFIGVYGELDFWTVDQFDAALQSALEERPARITLELSGLRFIDSSGIGVLGAALGTGIPIRLRKPTPAVRRVLEYTGLDGYLPVVT
jgi:anti-sigma B factor antagonist